MLQEVLVALISPSQASLLVKQLSLISPLSGLQHLKRVRKPVTPPGHLEIIVCPLRRPLRTAEQPVSNSEDAPQAQYKAWTEEELEGDAVPGPLQELISDNKLQLRLALVSSFGRCLIEASHSIFYDSDIIIKTLQVNCNSV